MTCVLQGITQLYHEPYLSLLRSHRASTPISCNSLYHGGMAGLSWPGWLVMYWESFLHSELNPDTVIHPSTNRARRWATSLMWQSELSLSQAANQKCWWKGKGQSIYIAPYCRQPTSKALGYGNSSRDLTVLPAHPCIYPRTEWTIFAFAFSAEAGTHLPIPKGWKAELAWATRTLSKQSTLDCYAMFIAAANRS